MAKQESLVVNFAEMTDDELYAFRDNLATVRAQIDEEWAAELASFASGDDFDPYSRSGERKIKKLAKKYANKTVGLNYLRDLTFEEIAKRDRYKEQQMYVKGGYGKILSEEEFLEREEIKTKAYKSRIE